MMFIDFSSHAQVYYYRLRWEQCGMFCWRALHPRLHVPLRLTMVTEAGVASGPYYIGLSLQPAARTPNIIALPNLEEPEQERDDWIPV